MVISIGSRRLLLDRQWRTKLVRQLSLLIARAGCGFCDVVPLDASVLEMELLGTTPVAMLRCHLSKLESGVRVARRPPGLEVGTIRQFLILGDPQQSWPHSSFAITRMKHTTATEMRLSHVGPVHCVGFWNRILFISGMSNIPSASLMHGPSDSVFLY